MTDASADSEVGKPGGKRERTRAALIAATLDVVGEKGFAGAGLDEIAARAGMTKGAIYSNFGGKGDLLLAALATKDITLSGPTDPKAPLIEQLRDMGRQLAAMIERAGPEGRFLAEFQLYAMGDPELRKSLLALYAQSFEGSAAYLAQAPDLRPGVSPRALAVTLQSLAIGFLVQSFLSPGEVTEAVMVETLAALGEGVSLKS